jgi:hypothetical protein
MRPPVRSLALVSLVLALAASVQSADQILIGAGSTWKYNDSGSNLGTAWRTRTYNDASWASGLAQLGYGDGDEATVLSYGSNPSNRRITYYFRRSFTVPNPSALAALTVRYVRDDGAVIYLNGTEVVRSNMPAGTIGYTTRATAAIGGADESAWLEAPLDPALLVAGTNVIAVEVHQQSPSSTDVSFDLELRAVDAQPPAPSVTLTAPANHAVLNDPTVTFTATVAAPAGLSTATLFVGGPARTVTFSGPAQVDDAQIVAETPTVADGSGASLNVDGQTPHAHALLRFPTLVGDGAGQVPAGATVTAASLQLNCTNAGNPMQAYQLTQSWVEAQATWNERSAGVPWGSAGADGPGSRTATPLTADCSVTGLRLVDVTPFVQAWVSGAVNHGVVLVDAGTDGVDFTSSESGASPVLSVSYRSAKAPVETKAVAGTAAAVSFTAPLPLAQPYFWNVQVTDVGGQQAWAGSDFDLTLDAGSPNAPALVAPADGATGVAMPATLAAAVSDPAGGPLAVTAALRQAAAPEFTIIALPDTQHYSEANPAIFTAQTQWIVDNVASRNIVFVTHEGDIVEHNSVVSEWQAANTSLSLLDGVVPYGMGPGNHDQPTTLYNQYFPFTRYQGLPWYGGHQGTLNDNNFQLFSGGGLDFVIVHLTFCPPASAVTWADSVFKAHPDRIGIMTTHGYLGLTAQRSVHGCTNTQYLWDGLAVPNPNLHFMLAGHVHGESRRTDVVNGHPVFQLLADYQDRPSGGQGWLRILRFVPAEDKVYVQTYSPWLNQYERDADSEFTLDFPMGGAFTPAGTATVASGGTASFSVPGLQPNTPYEWGVVATNAAGKSRSSALWRFTTGSGGPVNTPPVANNQSVIVVEDTATPITLTAGDANGDPLSYSVTTGPAHGTLSGSAPALTYVPAANYAGSDSVAFRVNDGQALSNIATVTIAVQAVNDAPTANADGFAAAAGATLSVTAPGVLGNDTDVDSVSLMAQIAGGPANGTLSLNANGSFTYTPAGGFAGVDTFTYRASDGVVLSGLATVTVTVAADTTAPTRSNLLPSGSLAAGTTQATLSLATNESATCRFSTTAGTAYAAMTGLFTATGGTAHSTTVSGLLNGSSYTYYVRCQDPAGNANTSDAAITFSVAAAPASALVAAYSFNEGAGAMLTDRSGRGHTGTVAGATWSTSGRYGGALSFDGVNDWVTVNDTAALDLTTGMTLEAWVNPTAAAAWRTVLTKEQPGGLAYALYGGNGSSRPAAFVDIGGEIELGATAVLAANAWTHLAVTYDGATLRIFVNGVQVATRAQAGALTTSAGVLRIGGNGVWGEYFQGRIDEIRLYNRALSAAEIQADMAAAITP